jgi:hypothetical protein
MQPENEKTAQRDSERLHLARQIGRLLAQEWVRHRALKQSERQTNPPVANVSEYEPDKLP